MNNPVTGLQIKQVAARTGLSEQLIRKWEQRYRAVTPRRMQNGYRVYQEHDVRILMSIAHLVERGIPVRRAVALVTAERGEVFDAASDSSMAVGVQLLQAQENTFRRRREQASEHVSEQMLEFRSHRARILRDNPLHSVLEAMLAAGAVGDLQRLETILQRCFVSEGLRIAVNCVVTPFLQEVGWLWSMGSWSEDQEHLSSLTVRNFLVRLLADLPDVPPDAPVLLASCVPGERHDIMLQVALLEAKRQGWRTLFLGPDPAPGAIERALTRLTPDVLLLSMTTRHEALEGRSVDCGCGEGNDAQTTAGGAESGSGSGSESGSVGAAYPGGVSAAERHESWFEKLNTLAAKMPATEVYLGGPASLVHSCVDGLPHILPLESLADCFDVLSRQTLAGEGPRVH
ncbi:MerR family transcriptional regulator [Alicyclobacillus sp. ALC3]|uniref:MerR family transcriptional regulator n=1 Tax=Alicyclobacillus sp. ALC3 TaxID=2796143 RepID=UPI00237A00A0|nr:MerR family transcriptional regulator [Alicyclobacillus sp. ALC3]WDL99076.1 MerR family transcriptional regulator [Alicyclobacillus sp. ALC3]